jgi:hypothetical protein
MMLWQEIILDINPSYDELLKTLAKLFEVSSLEVLVIDDISDADISNSVQIICEKIPIKGDFYSKTSIYLRNPKLEQNANKSMIGEFCELLHCHCLISDDSFNPFSMLLIQDEEKQQLVFLDVERLDEKEEYVIARRLESSKFESKT